MRFRSRSIEPDDIPQVFELMSRRVRPPRNALRSSATLIAGWRQLITRACIPNRLVEAPELPAGHNIIVAGLSAFVHEAWLQSYLRNPFPHPGAYVIKQCAAGGAADILLSDEEVATQNSTIGLRDLTLGIAWAPERVAPAQAAEGRTIAVQAFLQAHQGYYLSDILSECFEGLDCELFLGGGSWRIRDDYSRYYRSASRPPPSPRPMLIGLNRTEAGEVSASSAILAPLFSRRISRYGFDPGQQHLLLHALDYVDDKRLAQVLGIGHHALRRRWQRIFRRVQALQPANDPLIPAGCDAAGKRAHLLLRLPSEMHELRPHTTRVAYSKHKKDKG